MKKTTKQGGNQESEECDKHPGGKKMEKLRPNDMNRFSKDLKTA